MQLIKITSTPIKYELTVERPRLVSKPADNAQMKQKTTQGSFDIKTQNVQVRLDTMEMRSSIGLKSAPKLIQEAASRGYQAADKAKSNYVDMGNQLSQIQTGVGVADVVKQRMLEQPVSQTVFLPSTGPVISWIPNQIEMKYNPGELSVNWKIMESTMDYVPGKFQMEILQYPKITIQYLGEPNYVPPSASPNYKG